MSSLESPVNESINESVVDWIIGPPWSRSLGEQHIPEGSVLVPGLRPYSPFPSFLATLLLSQPPRSKQLGSSTDFRVGCLVSRQLMTMVPSLWVMTPLGLHIIYPIYQPFTL